MAGIRIEYQKSHKNVLKIHNPKYCWRSTHTFFFHLLTSFPRVRTHTHIYMYLTYYFFTLVLYVFLRLMNGFDNNNLLHLYVPRALYFNSPGHQQQNIKNLKRIYYFNRERERTTKLLPSPSLATFYFFKILNARWCNQWTMNINKHNHAITYKYSANLIPFRLINAIVKHFVECGIEPVHCVCMGT